MCSVSLTNAVRPTACVCALVARSIVCIYIIHTFYYTVRDRFYSFSNNSYFVFRIHLLVELIVYLLLMPVIFFCLFSSPSLFCCILARKREENKLFYSALIHALTSERSVSATRFQKILCALLACVSINYI